MWLAGSAIEDDVLVLHREWVTVIVSAMNQNIGVTEGSADGSEVKVADLALTAPARLHRDCRHPDGHGRLTSGVILCRGLHDG
jgi:hypothetical protein